MDFVQELFNKFLQDYDLTSLLLNRFNVEDSIWKGEGVELLKFHVEHSQ
jgi:hypothetical protein